MSDASQIAEPELYHKSNHGVNLRDRQDHRGAPIDISILVPTKNGEATISALLLAATKAQDTARTIESIVVDSGSRDRTVELARDCGATVRQIEPADFNHGLTRNLLASMANGTYLVFLSQDAVPADSHWLEALVRPMDDDVMLAGVFSAHRPRPGCDRITAFQIQHSWRLVGESFPSHTNVIADWRDYRLHPGNYVYFANTCAAIRRSVWAEYPFRSLNFAEDADWASRVLERGFKTRFEPKSVVVHSHHFSLAASFRRSFEHAQAYHELFGVSDPRPLPARLIAAAALSAEIAARSSPPGPGMIGLAAEAYARLVIQELGSWLGAARAVPQRFRRLVVPPLHTSEPA